MILRDPYAGHRSDDPWWVPDPVRDTQWTEWDYALLEASSVISTLTSKASGQLRMLTEDPDVYWEVEAVVDFAAKTVAEDRKDKDDEPGVIFYPANPTKRGGEPFWTVEQWVAYQEKENRVLERGAVEGARPPTAEEMAAIRAKRAEIAAEDAGG